MITKKIAPAVKAVKAVKKTPASKSVAKPVAKKTAPVKAVKPAVKKPVLNKTIKPALKTVKAVKADKVKKPKLVRDSFTMPQSEYDVLAQVKKTCITAGVEIKKSELLRIGVALLKNMDAKKIGEAKATLPALKAGRPSKHK